MNLKQKTLLDVNFNNKVVIVRVDFNVPIIDNKITDANRIIQTIPTLDYLVSKNAKIVLLSHLGRVKTEEDKLTKTLAPVAKRLSKIWNNKNIEFINKTRGVELETAINNLKPQEVIMVENTRFEDINGKKESKNDPELGKYWASLGDIFVNDAFGTAHRAHASNVGIANNIAISCVGLLVQKELEMLGKAIDNPAKPLVVILGGAKVSDKIGIIKNLIPKADKIIIGGGMSYTFSKALGYSIGTSLIENDKVQLAKELMTEAKSKIILPLDYAMAYDFKDQTPIFSDGINIDEDKMGLDIGPKTIKLFEKELDSARTIIWNGPLGVSEFKNFATGTIAICKTIANENNCFSLIGGGDSAAAAINLGYAKDFGHISTGGGATLEYLEGIELPGIASIQKK